MTNASAAFLAGGGPKGVKFASYGDTGSGPIIVEPTVEQQRDYDTGKPLTWDDGNPRLQLVVTIKTQLRDPSIPDDDGTRRLFVRSGMRAAVQKAIKDAGVDSLDVGGELTVTYTHDDGRTKQYKAVYVPPKPGAAAASYLADQPKAETTAAPTNELGLTVEDLQKLQARGVDTSALTPDALKALRDLGTI